jgi:redox-sensitive bicupin YhaK (pirin superfamily)
MSWNPCPEPKLGDRASCDAVELVIAPRAVDLGEMTVRRALPSAKRQMVGPFIFLDQMGPAEFVTNEGIDVRPHPHINLSTLTYLLEGRIWHRDSTGGDKLIEPGAVNWMRAGRGIVHSERTDAATKATGQRLFGLQSWMALPRAAEESEPAFLHHAAAEMPVIEAGGVTARLIAGEAFGAVSPLQPASPTLYVDAELTVGAVLPVDATYEERAVYVLKGEIEIAGDRFDTGQLLILRPGDPHAVRALSASRVMLFGGEPMEGPRWIWWNFVSSRLERIEAAREEWARGRFDTVPGDETEFIPLPEGLGGPRRAVGGRNFA